MRSRRRWIALSRSRDVAIRALDYLSEWSDAGTQVRVTPWDC